MKVEITTAGTPHWIEIKDGTQSLRITHDQLSELINRLEECRQKSRYEFKKISSDMPDLELL